MLAATSAPRASNARSMVLLYCTVERGVARSGAAMEQARQGGAELVALPPTVVTLRHEATNPMAPVLVRAISP